MGLEIRGVHGGVLDGISGMNHHAVAHVDGHMGYRSDTVVSAGEKHNVAWLGLRGWDDGALVKDPLGSGP